MSQSRSSSKRGIKTYAFLIVHIKPITQSRSSSKRGIKTRGVFQTPQLFAPPRVGHPAKEGLRRASNGSRVQVPELPE